MFIGLHTDAIKKMVYIIHKVWRC